MYASDRSKAPFRRDWLHSSFKSRRVQASAIGETGSGQVVPRPDLARTISYTVGVLTQSDRLFYRLQEREGPYFDHVTSGVCQSSFHAGSGEHKTSRRDLRALADRRIGAECECSRLPKRMLQGAEVSRVKSRN